MNALVLVRDAPVKEENSIHQIYDNIYLGNCDARAFVEKFGIKYIVQIGTREELEKYQPINGVIDYLSIECEDNRNADISSHFSDVYDFLDIYSRDKSPILIHCKAGTSRSVTCLAAYLIAKKGLTLQTALDLMRYKRQDKIYTHPNIGFFKILRKLSFDTHSKNPDFFQRINS